MIAIRFLLRVLIVATPLLGVTAPALADDLAPEPALGLRVELTFGGERPSTLYANGLPLRGSDRDWRAGANERGERDAGWSPAAVVLAIGVGLALVIAVAGETAEDITDR